MNKALDEIGGQDCLVQFAKKYPIEFFRALGKMPPREFNTATQRVGCFTGKDIEDITVMKISMIFFIS